MDAPEERCDARTPPRSLGARCGLPPLHGGPHQHVPTGWEWGGEHAADGPRHGCNCASYNNPERVRPTTSGPAPEVVMTPPFDLGDGRETVCVDACIATVVQHLWDCGIVTLGSCCGHGRGRPSLVLGPHEDFEIVRACIAEVIPKGRYQNDEQGWDLSQWRLVTNIDFSPAS